MTAKIISGTDISSSIREELKKRVASLVSNRIIPSLGVILVGDDPPSVSYVKSKEKGAGELGIRGFTVKMPVSTSENDLIKKVQSLNEDKEVDGILVQDPLPSHIDSEKVLSYISPEKDMDGSHPLNLGRLIRGLPCYLPCTPYGIQQMLIRSGCEISGKHVVICGRSNLVGKPLAAMLMQKNKGANAIVTVVHTAARDIGYYTRQADILVAAMGKPHYITADMVKPGSVVIDVGINRIEDKTRERGYRLVGDVDFEAVKDKAAAITPVPGGVGLMTVTMLLQNTVEAAEKRASLNR